MRIWFYRSLHYIVSLFVFFSLAVSVCVFADTASAFSPTVFDVTVNKKAQSYKNIFLLQDVSGHFFVNKDDLLAWNIVIPENMLTTNYMGKVFYALDDFTGVKYSVNASDMALDIVFPAQFFSLQKLSDNKNTINYITPSSSGFVLNYDTYANKTENKKDPLSLSSVFSTKKFSEHGVFVNDFLFATSVLGFENEIDNSFVQPSTSDNNKSKFVRLNSYWQKDNYDKIHTTIIGDTISSSGSWGSSLSFLGVHYGTDLAINPNLSIRPVLNSKGIATLPSTVDLYVNNVLVRKNKIDPGPFEIDNIPMNTGGGIVSIVTTDIMGRQEIVNMPFYTAGSLLQPGFKENSFDAGFIRQNYGTDSFNYGDFMAMMRCRKGVSNNFTYELRSEFLPWQNATGYSLTYLLGKYGTLDSSVVGSFANSYGAGGLLSLAWTADTYNKLLGYGITTQLTSYNMRYIGLDDKNLAPSSVSSAFVNLSFKQAGSLNFSYIQQKPRINPEYEKINTNSSSDNVYSSDTFSDTIGKMNRILNISYTNSLFKIIQLNAGIVTDLEKKDKTYFIRLSYDFRKAINNDISTSYRTNWEKNALYNGVSLSKQLPYDKGIGYNVDLTRSDGSSDSMGYNINIQTQNSIGNYSLGVAQTNNGVRGYNFNTRGSIVAMKDEGIKLGRKIYDSFVIVRTPGYANIGIKKNGLNVGKTNKKGSLLVPDVTAYTDSIIEVNANDVPLDAKITKTIKALKIARNSGVIVDFAVKPALGLLATIIDDKGEAVPAGAVVNFVDAEKKQEQIDVQRQENKNLSDADLILGFPVAQNGQVYLTDLDYGDNKMEATWNDTKCVFNIHYEKNKESYLPNVGNIVCNYVK